MMGKRLLILASLCILGLQADDGDLLAINSISCDTNTCGDGAYCVDVNELSICACLPGYTGDPLTQCTIIECDSNDDCPSGLSCVDQQCVDPCEGTCGNNAICEVSILSFINKNYIATCTCPAGYTGNPFDACIAVDAEIVLNL